MLDTVTLDNRYKKLFQDGKLVQVHVSKWGMHRNLTEKDLDLEKEIESEPTLPSFMRLGQKMLFTDEVRLPFGRIESAARNYLAINSHKFPIAETHFVTQKSLVKVLTMLEEYKETYDKATQNFLENYDQNKQKMLEKYPDYRAVLEPYYPTAEQVRHKFSFGVTFYEIAFPKALKSLTMVDVLAQNEEVAKMQEKYAAQMDTQYKQSVKMMEGFLQESAMSLRSEIVKTFEVIAAKIQNKEVVTGTNLNTLRKTIEAFDGLDFLDDNKIKENLKLVKSLVTPGATFKDDDTALAKLQAAVTTTLETARNMSDIDTLTGGYNRHVDIGEL